MVDLFSFFFPSAFLSLVVAHFVALLSPGPDFFLIVGHAIRGKVKGSIFICLGIAAGNAVYIIFTIAGLAELTKFPKLYMAMEIMGAVYLIWMGAMLLKSSRRPIVVSAHELKPLSPSSQFSAGFGSAILNPKNAIFYLTLMTLIIGPDATLIQQIVSGVWMVLAVFFWDVFIASAISHNYAQRILRTKIHFVEFVSGSILVLMALWLAKKVFREVF